MMRVRERRPEQRIQAQVKAQKEAKLGRVKQGWKASRKGAKERTKRSGIRKRLIFHLRYERYKVQKKSASALFTFFQQILIDARDLFEPLLNFSETADSLRYFWLQ